jgi:DNA-binding CsgD family transcriptional regulator
MGAADWREVGRRLAGAVDGASLSFTAQYQPGGGVDLVDMQGVTPQEIELYAASFIADDVWRNAAVGQRIVDRVVFGTDLVSEQDYLNSRIYTDLCRPNTDIFHGVMVTGTLPNAGIYSIGIHRPRVAKPFRLEHKRRLQDLLPHIRRALVMRSQLGLANAHAVTASHFIERLSFAVVQVTSDSQVLALNQAAQLILQQGDGLKLAGGVLRAVLSQDDAGLQAALFRAAQVTSGVLPARESEAYLRIGRPSGLKPYTVVVCPTGLDRVMLSRRAPAAILIINDPEHAARLDDRALTALFGLTPAEARLVALLATGKTLQIAAGELQIGFETARTQLARARAKTGTSSQADLVRTVLAALLPTSVEGTG